MLDVIETNQAIVVAVGFICVGIIALTKGRIKLENTEHYATDIWARLLGIIFIAVGILTWIWFV